MKLISVCCWCVSIPLCPPLVHISVPPLMITFNLPLQKILTMIPTEEEKQKIQEAQLANPDVPLGSAEQFLLTLSSISELSARLQLWAFKMDYEIVEKVRWAWGVRGRRCSKSLLNLSLSSLLCILTLYFVEIVNESLLFQWLTRKQLKWSFLVCSSNERKLGIMSSFL